MGGWGEEGKTSVPGWECDVRSFTSLKYCLWPLHILADCKCWPFSITLHMSQYEWQWTSPASKQGKQTNKKDLYPLSTRHPCIPRLDKHGHSDLGVYLCDFRHSSCDLLLFLNFKLAAFNLFSLLPLVQFTLQRRH